MSILLSDTTLTLNTKVQLSTEGYSLQDIDWIELTNHSPFACHVSTGGGILLMPAWYTYPIPLKDSRGSILPGLALPFSVTPFLQTIPGTGFTQTLHTVLYIKGETPNNTLPTPLGGGPIDLTIASEVISNDQPSGNTIVFGAPNGDGSASGATNIKNNGQETLGDTSNNGQLTVIHETAGSVDFSTVITGNDLSIADTAFQLINLLMGTTDPSIILENSAGSSVIDISTSSVSLTGGTSGSATMYQLFQGNIKITVIITTNFETAASNQDMTFPTAYIHNQLIFTTDNEGCSVLASGSAQTVRQLTALGGAGSAGTTGATTTLNGFGIFWNGSGIDTWRFKSGGSSGKNGVILIIGY